VCGRMCVCMYVCVCWCDVLNTDHLSHKRITAWTFIYFCGMQHAGGPATNGISCKERALVAGQTYQIICNAYDNFGNRHQNTSPGFLLNQGDTCHPFQNLLQIAVHGCHLTCPDCSVLAKYTKTSTVARMCHTG